MIGKIGAFSRLTPVQKVVRRKPDKSEQDEKKDKPNFSEMLKQALDHENKDESKYSTRSDEDRSLNSQKESLQALKSLLKAPEEL